MFVSTLQTTVLICKYFTKLKTFFITVFVCVCFGIVSRNISQCLEKADSITVKFLCILMHSCLHVLWDCLQKVPLQDPIYVSHRDQRFNLLSFQTCAPAHSQGTSHSPEFSFAFYFTVFVLALWIVYYCRLLVEQLMVGWQWFPPEAPPQFGTTIWNYDLEAEGHRALPEELIGRQKRFPPEAPHQEPCKISKPLGSFNDHTCHLTNWSNQQAWSSFT